MCHIVKNFVFLLDDFSFFPSLFLLNLILRSNSCLQRLTNLLLLRNILSIFSGDITGLIQSEKRYRDFFFKDILFSRRVPRFLLLEHIRLQKVQ